jgi:hypothetical protein
MVGLQLLGAQPRACGRSGRQVLDEHVGVRQQLSGDGDTTGVLDVERERLLVAVGPREV